MTFEPASEAARLGARKGIVGTQDVCWALGETLLKRRITNCPLGTHSEMFQRGQWHHVYAGSQIPPLGDFPISGDYRLYSPCDLTVGKPHVPVGGHRPPQVFGQVFKPPWLPRLAARLEHRALDSSPPWSYGSGGTKWDG